MIYPLYVHVKCTKNHHLTCRSHFFPGGRPPDPHKYDRTLVISNSSTPSLKKSESVVKIFHFNNIHVYGKIALNKVIIQYLKGRGWEG
jgi:hypothetical protein